MTTDKQRSASRINIMKANAGQILIQPPDFILAEIQTCDVCFKEFKRQGFASHIKYSKTCAGKSNLVSLFEYAALWCKVDRARKQYLKDKEGFKRRASARSYYNNYYSFLYGEKDFKSDFNLLRGFKSETI